VLNCFSILKLSNFVFTHRNQKKEQKEPPPKVERPKSPEPEPEPKPEPSPRPKSAKYRHREPAVINVPEPRLRREIAVNQGSQTVDDVGIQTERKLLEEYEHVCQGCCSWVDFEMC